MGGWWTPFCFIILYMELKIRSIEDIKKISLENWKKEIVEYFKKNHLPTMNGLYVWLGINKKKAFHLSFNDADKYDLLQSAKEMVKSVLVEIAVYGSTSSSIRTFEIDGKIRYIDTRGAVWYLRNIDPDEFSDNPQLTASINEQKRIILTLENKGENNIWKTKKAE